MEGEEELACDNSSKSRGKGEELVDGCHGTVRGAWGPNGCHKGHTLTTRPSELHVVYQAHLDLANRFFCVA